MLSINLNKSFHLLKIWWRPFCDKKISTNNSFKNFQLNVSIKKIVFLSIMVYIQSKKELLRGELQRSVEISINWIGTVRKSSEIKSSSAYIMAQNMVFFIRKVCVLCELKTYFLLAENVAINIGTLTWTYALTLSLNFPLLLSCTGILLSIPAILSHHQWLPSSLSIKTFSSFDVLYRFIWKSTSIELTLSHSHSQCEQCFILYIQQSLVYVMCEANVCISLVFLSNTHESMRAWYKCQ